MRTENFNNFLKREDYEPGVLILCGAFNVRGWELLALHRLLLSILLQHCPDILRACVPPTKCAHANLEQALQQCHGVSRAPLRVSRVRVLACANETNAQRLDHWQRHLRVHAVRKVCRVHKQRRILPAAVLLLPVSYTHLTLPTKA